MINTAHWSERWPDHPQSGHTTPRPSASIWGERYARFFKSRAVSRWIGGGLPTHFTIVSTAKTTRNQLNPAQTRHMSPATGKPVPPMLATLGHPPTGERWRIN